MSKGKGIEQAAGEVLAAMIPWTPPIVCVFLAIQERQPGWLISAACLAWIARRG